MNFIISFLTWTVMDIQRGAISTVTTHYFIIATTIRSQDLWGKEKDCYSEGIKPTNVWWKSPAVAYGLKKISFQPLCEYHCLHSAVNSKLWQHHDSLAQNVSEARSYCRFNFFFACYHQQGPLCIVSLGKMEIPERILKDMTSTYF